MLNLLGINFHLYGLLIGLGIVAAVEASEWMARQKLKHLDGQAEKIVSRLVWWVIPPGIVGARIYHVIDLWTRYYSVQPIKVLYIWEGGLAIWGAIIGGLIGLFVHWLIWRKGKDDLLDLLDITLFGVPLAQAIGRWGNYFNGELIGKNGEPLFLYESVLNLVLFGILVGIAKHHHDESGRIAGIYLTGYGLTRLLLEPLRADTIIWRVAGVPTAQIFSVAAMAIGIVILITPRRWWGDH